MLSESILSKYHARTAFLMWVRSAMIFVAFAVLTASVLEKSIIADKMPMTIITVKPHTTKVECFQPS